MDIFQSMTQPLKDSILCNSIVWGRIGVAIRIVGLAFIKAWRGKDEE